MTILDMWLTLWTTLYSWPK